MTITDEFRSWLDGHSGPELTLREYWSSLAEAGWAFPTWPRGRGGRDLDPVEAREITTVMQEAGAIAPPAGLGQMMGGPVVIEYGTEEQQDRWLADLAAGRESWCQLFSEPGAGSDLASLQTKAVRDGDVWIVNGQKVWTSGARTADRAMLVVRTDADAPKHKGISYFIIDMEQPGIEVRPLKQMDGGATFNEVFLTEAVVPHENLIGSPNNGWMVAVSTLAYERAGIGGRGGGGMAIGAPGEKNGLLDLTIAELRDRAARTRNEQSALAAATTANALFDLAREFGKAEDPVTRQAMMRHYALTETHRLNLLRARAASAAGKRPGPEVSTAKLTTSKIAHTTRDLTLGIEGAHAMLLGDDAPHGGRYQQAGLRAHASSIAGGSDEIQRNIIGERVLGLPKEPQVDRDLPFKELKVGTQK